MDHEKIIFEEILSRYERGVFGYIFNLVRQQQDAEDLTQETFLKVYSNLGSINSDGNPKGWVYRVAANTVYDWFRKKKIGRETLIIDDPEANFETIDPNSAYINIETSKDLEAALGQLRVVYRSVLMLFYWQGFSYEEIASQLSLPTNTVKTYLRRAKQALKETLLGNG